MVVLGQLADGVDPTDIEVGMDMKLELATLYPEVFGRFDVPEHVPLFR